MFLFAAFLFAASSAPAPALTLEIQRTPAELTRGLQGHRPLLEHEGMLFVFPEPKTTQFWMKDVTFPIDIVFLNAEHRVLNVAEEAKPCSRRPCRIYESDGEASFVLELPAGWSGRYGIDRGARFDLDLPNRKASLSKEGSN